MYNYKPKYNELDKSLNNDYKEILSSIMEIAELSPDKILKKYVTPLYQQFSLIHFIKKSSKDYRETTYKENSQFPIYPANLTRDNFDSVEKSFLEIAKNNKKIFDYFHLLDTKKRVSRRNTFIKTVASAGLPSNFKMLSASQQEEQAKTLLDYAAVLIDALEYKWEKDPIHTDVINQLKLMDAIESTTIRVCEEQTQNILNAFSDTQDAIITQVSEHTKRTNYFSQIIDKQKAKFASNDSLHYSYPHIDLYGRESELKQLEDFIEAPNRLLFWAITGPGGIGKSKLAYSFIQKHENNRDWKMLFLPSSCIQEFLKLEEWSYSKNLLLVIDYAATSAISLGDWLQKLAPTITSDSNKIRLLLLERQSFSVVSESNTKDEVVIAPEWYYQLCKPRRESPYPDSSYMHELQFRYNQNPCMLRLEGLKQEDYFLLIGNYCKAKSNRTLSLTEMESILNFVEEKLSKSANISNDSRPLYVLLVTNAALDQKHYQGWSLEGLMNYIYTRNQERWIDNFQNAFVLLNALQELLIFSTITGSWTFNEELPQPLSYAEKIIQDNRILLLEDPAPTWVAILTGHASSHNGIPVLPALEPDLIGEYFVIQKFLRFGIEHLKKWCGVLLEYPKSCIDFFSRCFQDYCSNNYIEDDENKPVIPPFLLKICTLMGNLLETQPLDNSTNSKASLVAILSRNFYHSLDTPLRGEVRVFWKNFSYKWMNSSQKVAEIYIQEFHINSRIRGQQKEQCLELSKTLYEQWPNSSIIAQSYIELIGEVGRSRYGAGQIEEGDKLEADLYELIKKWNNYDKNIAKSCVTALGKIMVAQHKVENDENSINNTAALRRFIEIWPDDNFTFHFIDIQAEIALAQHKNSQQAVCSETILTICQTLKSWQPQDTNSIWKTIDSITTLVSSLFYAGGIELAYPLIHDFCDFSMRVCEANTGIAWRCTQSFDYILDLDFEEPDVKRYIYKTAEYPGLRWWN